MFDQPLGALGTPGLGFVAMLFIGVIAGWIAEKATSSDHGLLTNVLVGVAGSFVGTRLAEVFGVFVTGTFGHLVAATVGAILVIVVWRAIQRQRA